MADIGECARCGNEFIRSKSNHRFCSTDCRHAGERRAHEPPAADPRVIERLFDEARSGSDRADPEDWHPGPPAFKALDALDSLERRRRWYLELRARGMV